MFLGSLGLWTGMPLLALWAGSRMQAASGSLGAAIAVAAFAI